MKSDLDLLMIINIATQLTKKRFIMAIIHNMRFKVIKTKNLSPEEYPEGISSHFRKESFNSYFVSLIKLVFSSSKDIDEHKNMYVLLYLFCLQLVEKQKMLLMCFSLL